MQCYYWNRFEYFSLKEAAEDNGKYSYSQFYFYYIIKGCRSDLDVWRYDIAYKHSYSFRWQTPAPPKKEPKSCFWNGKHYKTIYQAAIETGLSHLQINSYIKKGYQSMEDFERKPNRILIKDCFYNSIKEAMLHLNLSKKMVLQNIDLDEDTIRKQSKYYDCTNEQYYKTYYNNLLTIL